MVGLRRELELSFCFTCLLVYVLLMLLKRFIENTFRRLIPSNLRRGSVKTIDWKTSLQFSQVIDDIPSLK
jgi:hypothetical protein